MNLVQRLIPAKFKDTRPGLALVPKYITIHETDNTGLKANAEAHARLQEGGNSRQASWHVQVDDTQAIQSIPFNEVSWAAGDGTNGPGNRQSIHIEICVNNDGDYKKAVQNAAELVRDLMPKLNVPVENVVQHNHWSGKNCPSIMRSGSAGITWNDFINMIKPQLNGWKKEDSIWYFYKNGSLVKNDWVKHTDGKWYFLKDDGKMAAAEWIKWKDKWYYLLTSGAMATGIIEDKGKLYYLQPDGSMLASGRISVSLNVTADGSLHP
jgi:hypothetical protein